MKSDIADNVRIFSIFVARLILFIKKSISKTAFFILSNFALLNLNFAGYFKIFF